MENELTFKELLDHINSSLEESKPNSTIGLFVSNYYEDNKVQEDKNFIVKKPMVTISSFVEDNELYHNVSLHFKSYNDADYKQLWRFISDFAEKAKAEGKRLEAGEVLKKLAVLSVSIVPEKYNGKYFAYINMPFYETLSRTENAFDGTAVVSFICEDKGFGMMTADDDMIDRSSIEREVEQELDAEFSVPEETAE